MCPAGARPQDGVPDMTVISEIDEYGINTNLKVRFHQGRIYVSHRSSARCLVIIPHRHTLALSSWQ